jgi:hypothetical protein
MSAPVAVAVMPQPSVLALKTDEIHAVYSRYVPPHMLGVGAEYKGISPGLSAFGMALLYLANQSELEDPVLPVMTMEIKNTAAKFWTLVKQAADFYELFMQVHEDDVKRYSQPIKGQLAEERWNIVAGLRTDGGMIETKPSVFSAVCFSLTTIYATFKPVRMMDVYREYVYIPVAIMNLRHALKQLGDRTADASGGFPVDKTVRDTLAGLLHQLEALASETENLARVMRANHAHRINKHENPRVNEKDWDV